MASRLIEPYLTYNNSAGTSVLSGGKLHFYAAGTVSTDKDTFSDNSLATANTNPIILDSAGRANVDVWGDGDYDIVVADSSDVQIERFDNVSGSGNLPTISTIANLTALLKSTLTNQEQRYISQYAVQGDQGGGYFEWNSASTTTANSVTVFSSDEGGTGRWIRINVDVVTVRMGGAAGDGVTNDTAAFTLVRAATSNSYYIPSGTYILDATPDVKADPFSAGDGVTLTIAGTPYDVSNNLKGQLVAGDWNSTVMNIKGAFSGATLFRISDGSTSGQSHQVFLPWDIRRDSHALIMAPETENGITDVLWRRSSADAADSFGNRFSMTYDDANERLQMSYATNASGSSTFDTVFQVYNGADATPRIEYPALGCTFNQNTIVQQRSSPSFGLETALVSAEVDFRDSQSPSTVFMTFRTGGAFGFHGSNGTSQQTITGSRGANAALASLLTALANTGLIVDSTT